MGILVRHHILTLWDINKLSTFGYSADGPCRWMQSLGSTINMYVLWEDVILTVNPEHLKVCVNELALLWILISLYLQIILATDFPTYVKGKLVISSI